jgi:hypothetical protein
VKYFFFLLRTQNDLKYSTHKGFQLAGWLSVSGAILKFPNLLRKCAAKMRSGPLMWAWVRIPLLTEYFKIITLDADYIGAIVNPEVTTN